MSPTNSIQAVLFDLGYTLINFEGDFGRVMRESYLVLSASLQEAGYSFDTEGFVDRFNIIINEYYRSREEDLTERPIEQYLSRVLASYEIYDPLRNVIQNSLERMYRFSEQYWQLEEDALSTLEQLKADGYRLGMITNAANADNANRLIDRFELRPYFEVILISALEKIRKPDTRIYSRAITRFDLPPASFVMIGDTLTADILGAQNAGLHAIWIKRRADRAENQNVADRIVPDAVIETLAQLPAKIHSL